MTLQSNDGRSRRQADSAEQEQSQEQLCGYLRVEAVVRRIFAGSGQPDDFAVE
jgi:hypothetical protein